MLSRVEIAAGHNAYWCDLVCRAHGIPGEFHDRFWLNRRQVPRFYPNAVTLSADAGTTAVQELVSAKIPGGVTVKDSFCALDLAPLSFSVLFEASWLWRDASRPAPVDSLPGVRWEPVRDESELSRWELAWNGQEIAQRVFLPLLLADRDTLFFAAHQEEQIVAGCIAYRAGGVVGLSNVFARMGDVFRSWAGCVSAVMAAFPGLPIVDFESGGELAIASTLGFEKIGRLRVWKQAMA